MSSFYTSAHRSTVKIFQKYYLSLNAANCPSCNTVQESFASDLWHLKTLEQWFGERIFNSQFALQLVKKHAFFCHLKPGDHSKQGGSFFLDSSLSLRFLPLVESWGGKTPFFPSVFNRGIRNYKCGPFWPTNSWCSQKVFQKNCKFAAQWSSTYNVIFSIFN